MTNQDQPDKNAGYAVLRTLALKATGLSGADIERLVRESKQKARRQGRSLQWTDLEWMLSVSRPPKHRDLRWRMALHEAGHAIARLVLNRGTITLITIDGPDGNGMVMTTEPELETETEKWFGSLLVVKLAGRAAEEILLGSVVAGAGGSQESDLGRATALALQMEVAFGFGSEMPLLFRNAEEQGSLLIYSREIAQRVNTRLERAYSEAQKLIRCHRTSLQLLAEALMTHETLEGRELAKVLRFARDEMLRTVGGRLRSGSPAGNGARAP